MKTFYIKVSQNGWEYAGYFKIKCNELIRDENNKCIVHADHVTIEFDEEVGDIQETEWTDKDY
jgi:hypothetical protein